MNILAVAGIYLLDIAVQQLILRVNHPLQAAAAAHFLIMGIPESVPAQGGDFVIVWDVGGRIKFKADSCRAENYVTKGTLLIEIDPIDN